MVLHTSIIISHIIIRYNMFPVSNKLVAGAENSQKKVVYNILSFTYFIFYFKLPILNFKLQRGVSFGFWGEAPRGVGVAYVGFLTPRELVNESSIGGPQQNEKLLTPYLKFLQRSKIVNF